VGLVTVQYTFLTGAIPNSTQWQSNFSTLFTLVNGQLDSANVDKSSSDGIMVLDTAQTRTAALTMSGAKIAFSGASSAASWTTTGVVVSVAAATYTDTSTAGSGTAATATFASFAQPTLAATNTLVTTTDAATVYIAEAPTAGTNQTITNAHALWVAAGNVKLGGTSNLVGVTTHGGNIISDTDSTDDIGTTSVRWANVYTDAIGDTGQALTLKATTLTGGATLTMTTASGAMTFTPATDVHISDGKGMVIGHTAQVNPQGILSEFQILGTSGGADTSAVIGSWNNSSSGPFFHFAKSRGASIGTSAIVQADDELGSFYWGADDGTDLISFAARIGAFVDGTPGANDTPGRLIFYTTPDGSQSSIERLRITNGGVLTTLVAAPANITATGAGIFKGGLALTDVANAHIDDATHGTGTVTHYIGNQTIDTTASDVRLKENITTPNGTAQRHLRLLSAALREYDYKNGDGHFVGLVAQDILGSLPGYVVGNEEQYSVRYHYMVGPLLFGWQDHERRLTELERKAA